MRPVSVISRLSDIIHGQTSLWQCGAASILHNFQNWSSQKIENCKIGKSTILSLQFLLVILVYSFELLQKIVSVNTGSAQQLKTQIPEYTFTYRNLMPFEIFYTSAARDACDKCHVFLLHNPKSISKCPCIKSQMLFFLVCTFLFVFTILSWL